MTGRWTARQTPDPLIGNTLHLWSMHLDVTPAEVARARQLLAPDEQERAARFHFERDAARYIVGRGRLRRLLASYSGTSDPASLALSYGPHGKPVLSEPASSETLHFNLAHTSGFALLAVTRVADIGVDVERANDFPDMASVMRVSFAPSESAAVSALRGDDLVRGFYRCWTRKEAVLKALGWGLARPLDSFGVSIDEGDARVLWMVDDPVAPERWRLLHLIPEPGYIAAVAWIGPAMTAQCFAYDA